ncbi:hypothetical protein V6N13_107970 [Hibiscus sabdariffa]
MSMDADCAEGMEPLLYSSGGVVDPRKSLQDQFPLGSYASKVAGEENKGNGFLEEEVIIREEDVLINRNGLIPSICFSDKVHDQVDRNMRNAFISDLGCSLNPRQSVEESVGVHSRVGTIAHVVSRMFESELYGPWMIVQDMRHKLEGQLVNLWVAVHGSRFASLSGVNEMVNLDAGYMEKTIPTHSKEQVEREVTSTNPSIVEGSTVPKNATYRASNLDKCVKSAIVPN